jgi:adenine-specific DNA-methyltransferase
LGVSTGRVVDFRAKEFLVAEGNDKTVPLIYPCHMKDGYVEWPKAGGRKPNAILCIEDTSDLLVPNEVYVLVKRFTSKEESRRVVAVVYDPSRVPTRLVGFENHLNYYHEHGKGLPIILAKGLAMFLNSTLVDTVFRQFNGHTQVNATDLRSLGYPTRVELEALGKSVGREFPSQDQLDSLVERALF